MPRKKAAPAPEPNPPRACPQCGGPIERRYVVKDPRNPNAPGIERTDDADREVCHACRTGKGRVVELFVAANVPPSQAMPADRLNHLGSVHGWGPVRDAAERRFEHDGFSADTWRQLWLLLQARYGARSKILAARLEDVAKLLERHAPEEARAQPADPVPSEPADLGRMGASSLARQLRAERKTLQATLVEFLAEHGSATYAGIAEHVQGDAHASEDAIRATVNRTNKSLEALESRARVSCGGGYVHWTESPE
jgi:hypothetical protein